MADKPKTPTICLNMIVRDEAHIVCEGLDAIVPFISSWVIVDTGSTDGTLDLIRRYMKEHDIPGELHERPWRNFGHNRSEALDLAAGAADYIWVMDADDLLIGTPDFSELTGDLYEMQLRAPNGIKYWRAQLVRSGLPWRYNGVVHEHLVCDKPYGRERLEGDYFIESRRLGARNKDPDKYAKDRDLLLGAVEENPDDARSVFYLAQSYFDLYDYPNAIKWYQRRSEMGGWEEEVFYSMYRVGVAMLRDERPWPETQDAFLRAWAYRPTRAEALFSISRYYCAHNEYVLGRVFSRMAAEIPFPVGDRLFVPNWVYDWNALDDQAVCASQLGLHREAFDSFRELLARPLLPEGQRARVAVNRDYSVPEMLAVAVADPDPAVAKLARVVATPEVTVTLAAGADLAAARLTLNSLVNSCTDVLGVGHLLVDDAGLPERDRATLRECCPLAESTPGPAAQIPGRYWLRVAAGWQFFAPEPLISRLVAVLDAEPQVFAVAVNYQDAAELTGLNAPEDESIRRSDATGRYVLTDDVPRGPAMFHTARLDQLGPLDTADGWEVLARRARAAGMRCATLDEVLCVNAGC